jgi:hypothetical protein
MAAVLKTLRYEAWVKAVAEGADDKSPRWRHTLLLGGILMGFEVCKTAMAAVLKTLRIWRHDWRSTG